ADPRRGDALRHRRSARRAAEGGARRRHRPRAAAPAGPHAERGDRRGLLLRRRRRRRRGRPRRGGDPRPPPARGAPPPRRRRGGRLRLSRAPRRRPCGASILPPCAEPITPRPRRVGRVKYFVTGATGFIGRHLLPLLLQREGEIAVLVRPGSRARFAALRDRLDPSGTRLRAVIGDIAEPGLGVADGDRASLQGAHVFHLAAIYDLLAGTLHTVEFANAVGATCLHHVSSIAVAGRWRGRFTEEMFDVGQPLDHAYFSTKYEAEKIVREQSRVPFRVYRPGMVIGSSQTGEADRVDGPYYAFKLIQKLRD